MTDAKHSTKDNRERYLITFLACCLVRKIKNLNTKLSCFHIKSQIPRRLMAYRIGYPPTVPIHLHAETSFV